MGASRQCFSKPAPWVVAKRVRQRELGYRSFQILQIIKTRLEAGLPPLSYSAICEELGMDCKGNVARVIRTLQLRGEIEAEPITEHRKKHSAGLTYQLKASG